MPFDDLPDVCEPHAETVHIAGKPAERLKNPVHLPCSHAPTIVLDLEQPTACGGFGRNVHFGGLARFPVFEGILDEVDQDQPHAQGPRLDGGQTLNGNITCRSPGQATEVHHHLLGHALHVHIRISGLTAQPGVLQEAIHERRHTLGGFLQPPGDLVAVHIRGLRHGGQHAGTTGHVAERLLKIVGHEHGEPLPMVGVWAFGVLHFGSHFQFLGQHSCRWRAEGTVEVTPTTTQPLQKFTPPSVQPMLLTPVIP